MPACKAVAGVRRLWMTGWHGTLSDVRGLAVASRRRGQQRRDRRRQQRFGRTRFLAKITGIIFAAAVLLDFPVALAADDKAGSVWFNWLGATDSYKNAPARYDLRVSQGGMTDPITAIGAFLLGWFWDIYRLLVSLMVWAFQFVLEFKFLDVVRVPANTIAQVIQDVTTQLGIVPVVAGIAVLVSGFRLLKGQFAGGMGEIAVTAVVVALLSTALANPVGLITGEDGLLVKARDAGAEFTTKLLYPDTAGTPSQSIDASDPEAPEHGGTAPSSTTPATGSPRDAARAAMSSRMLDTFVRTPHQLLNFGTFIDAKKESPNQSADSAITSSVDTSDDGRVYPDCFNAYNKAFGGGGSVNDMTKGDTCPKVAKDTLEHPDRSLVGAYMVMWAVFWTMLFGLVLLVASAFLIGLATFEAAKFVLSLLRSIMPGQGRESVFIGAANIAVASFLAMLTVVAIGVYLITLNAVFNATSGWNPVVVYVFIDFVAVIFIIGSALLFFRSRKRSKELGRRAADAMTPKSAPKAMATGGSRGGVLAANAARYALTKSAGAMSGARAARHHAPDQPPASTRHAPQSIGRGQPKASTSARVAKGVLKGAGKTAKYAAMYTVGAPVAVPKAAAAAKVGTKAALNRATSTIGSKASSTKRSLGDRRDSAVDGAKAYKTEYVQNLRAGGALVKNSATAGGRQQLRDQRQQRRQPARSQLQNLVDLQQRLGSRVDPRMQHRAQQANQAIAKSRMTTFQRYEEQAREKQTRKAGQALFTQRTPGPTQRRNQELRAWMEQARANPTGPRASSMPTGRRG